MPDQPPRQDDADDTINPENEADEASYESFPASDPPAHTGSYAGKTNVDDDEGIGNEDEEE